MLTLSLILLAAAPDAPLARQELVPPPAPFRAEVTDPLLAPPPAPAVELQSWEQARQLLREQSTDERQAAAGVERASGRWRQALGVLFPNLNASASSQVNALDLGAPYLGAGTPPDASNPAVAGSISASQSLIDVPAWRGVSAASAAERSAEATLSDVRRRLTGSLARGLVSVIAAERIAELNRLGLRQALERVALTERTRELGAATQLDVTRVRQDAELARGTLVAGDEQLLRARDALGLALGAPRGVAPSSTFNLNGLVEELKQVCRPSSWESRGDLIAARESARSATHAREQASAGYLPSVRAQSNLTGYTTDPGFGRLGVWSIGAVLSVPLWEGGIREGLVRERRGAETQSEAALEATRRAVEQEVLQAERRVGIADALLSSARQARELAAELDALTRRAFEVGRGSSLELVQSAQALRQADVLLAQREFELVQARLDAFLTEAQCNW